MDIIELRPTKNGGWYWRVRAKNGHVLCHSETYERKGGALKSIYAFMGRHQGFALAILPAVTPDQADYEIKPELKGQTNG